MELLLLVNPELVELAKLKLPIDDSLNLLETELVVEFVPLEWLLKVELA